MITLPKRQSQMRWSSRIHKSFTAILGIISILLGSPYSHAATSLQPQTSVPLKDTQLLDEIQHRAFLFFWERSDPATGLTNDRAKNTFGEDAFTVASIASTGYALAALPIAVEHHWIEKQTAYDRALITLKFVHDKLACVHGFYYHFIDKRTGERVWSCELSSIDTTLLVIGALEAAQYWNGTEVEKLANEIYHRMDWQWMRTNGGLTPNKLVVSMGWNPEKGFIASNWENYCELMTLYMLAMGEPEHPLGVDSWKGWKRNEVEYGGRKTLAGGPIFMHQMAQSFFNFKNQRDVLGYDYWVTSEQATLINRQFCIDHSKNRKSYTDDIWGLNACDAPDGYNAFGAPGDENGTVSPTGALASLIFTPEISIRSANVVYAQLADKVWGKYGYIDSFNLDRDWFDPDVIGIDLGMVIVAIEDYRTGLPWRLIQSHPDLKRAWKIAGFHTTKESTPRPMRVQ